MQKLFAVAVSISLLTPSSSFAEVRAEAVLDEHVITAESYRQLKATTGLKMPVDIKDIPQAVAVVPRKVAEDRGAVYIGELLDNVSGVQRQAGYGGTTSLVSYIRGFRTGSQTLRNGFKDFGFISTRELANVEQVEVLKGPSTVYGSFEPSGVINTITKKPLGRRHAGVSVTAGSWDLFRTTLDVGGPLAAEGRFGGRLNAAYETADSYRDHVESESVFASPVVSWAGERFKATAEVEVQQREFLWDRGLPFSRQSLRVPASRFLGEPDTPLSRVESSQFYLDLENKVGDRWVLRNGVNASYVDGKFYNRSPLSLQADGRTVNRTALNSEEVQENYAYQLELRGELDSGSIRHQLLVGGELGRYDFGYDFLFAMMPSIDLFNPVYGGQPGAFFPLFAEEYYGKTSAVHATDLISLAKNWKVLIGGRFDSVETELTNRQTGKVTREGTDEAVSPRAGLIFQPAESTSIYASWARSFSPIVFGLDQQGQPFDPEKGEGVEAGVKQEFLDRRLSATLAAFEIKKKNLTTPDPNAPTFNIQTGEQRSRGVELDVAGSLTPGLDLIAAAAYTDAQVTDDNRLKEGARLQNIPYVQASLWGKYTFQEGSLRGFGAGIGVYHVGDREAQLPNTFEVPEYTRVDAALSYGRERWKAQLNLKNITDKKYYDSTTGSLLPQAPFTVQGTLSAAF